MTETAEKKALLDWYVEAGVDETIGNAPVDRLVTAQSAADPAQKAQAVRAGGLRFAKPRLRRLCNRVTPRFRPRRKSPPRHRHSMNCAPPSKPTVVR